MGDGIGGSTHATQTGGQCQGMLQAASKALASSLGKRLIGALHDTLRADVNPGTSGHLAIHCQAHGFQATKFVPCPPVGNEVGIGDESPRCAWVGMDDAHGLTGLYKERLVIFETPQRAQIASKHSQLRAALPEPP
jgi:hypothetical protein